MRVQLRSKITEPDAKPQDLFERPTNTTNRVVVSPWEVAVWQPCSKCLAFPHVTIRLQDGPATRALGEVLARKTSCCCLFRRVLETGTPPTKIFALGKRRLRHLANTFLP